MTCAYLAALRIVELRMVSEASFSFGITSRALSAVRMKVYMSPISSTAPSTPLTSTQSPSRSGCVIAIMRPATKLPSVRCAAKPMISPSTAEEASSPPATARTCGITSSAESSAERRRSRPRCCGAAPGSASAPRASWCEPMIRRSISRATRPVSASTIATTSRRCQSSMPAGFYARSARSSARGREALWCNGRDELAPERSRGRCSSAALVALAYGSRLSEGKPPENALYRTRRPSAGSSIYLILLLRRLDRAGAAEARVLRSATGRRPGAARWGSRSAATSRSSSAPVCSSSGSTRRASRG